MINTERNRALLTDLFAALGLAMTTGAASAQSRTFSRRGRKHNA